MLLGGSRSNGDMLCGEEFFYVADGVFSKMKDAGGEHGVGFAFQQHLGHVFQFSSAAAGDHGHSYGFTHSASDDQVKASFGAIGINAVQHDIARAKRPRSFGPFEGIEPSRFASAVREYLPLVPPDLLRV